MTYLVNTNSHKTEVSLRYCSCCLKKFCPNPAKTDGNNIRFFVPTIDSLFRSHFAYVEISRKLLDAIYNSEEKFSVDLGKVANVLHIEMGDCPSEEREQEIVSFYGFSEHLTGETYNRLAA